MVKSLELVKRYGKDPNNKEPGYFSTAWGAVLSVVVFILLYLMLPFYSPGGEMNLIITAAAILFGIIAVFFIIDRYRRFDRMRELLAAESSALIGAYEAANLMSKRYGKEMADAIDGYYQEGLKYNVDEFSVHVGKNIHKLFGVLEGMKPNSDRDVEIFENELENLNKLNYTAKKMMAVSTDRMSGFQWFILLILSFIMIFSLFYSRTATIYSAVFVVLLSSAATAVLLVIRDLNSMRWRELRVWEAVGQVYDVIGKKRYYPLHVVVAKRVRPEGSFRVGIYKNKRKELEVVEVKG
jgi:ABC-type multidrug transport system fused ATPase/permease subunit